MPDQPCCRWCSSVSLAMQARGRAVTEGVVVRSHDDARYVPGREHAYIDYRCRDCRRTGRTDLVDQPAG